MGDLTDMMNAQMDDDRPAPRFPRGRIRTETLTRAALVLAVVAAAASMVAITFALLRA